MSAAPADPVLHLVDISSFIFRAFYAIRPLTTPKGEPVNAVYGVATMLAKLFDEARPTHLAVTYDSKEPSFREELYPEYKANRAECPPDLMPQFARIEELVRRMHLPSFRRSGIEADDLIATLTARWTARSPANRVMIVTGDKDLMQLVTDRVSVWDTMAEKKYGPKEVEEKFGVRPDQIRDYLGLVGDSSDNIPGVQGVGPKTAVELLRKHGTLEGVLLAAQAGEVPGKRGVTIAEQAASARLSATLATVKGDLELPELELGCAFAPDAALVEFLEELNFKSLAKRWSERGSAADSGVATSAGTTRPAVPSAGAVNFAASSSGAASSAASSSGAPSSAAPGNFPNSAPTSAAPTPTSSATTPELSITGGESRSGAPASEADRACRLVTDLGELSTLVERIARTGETGFDLETTSLNPRAAQIVGIALAPDVTAGFYLPIGHRGPGADRQLPREAVLERVVPLLEDAKVRKIGQNLKYDWSVLIENGVKPRGLHADTMVAGYVLQPEGRHNLETLAKAFLDYDVRTYAQVCGVGKDAIGFDEVDIDVAARYSAEDAWIAMRLWAHLEPRLREEGLYGVYETCDQPMVEALVRMELRGVCLDTAWLAQLSQRFGRELLSIEERVRAFAPGPVNLQSPKQLAQLLFEHLKLPPQGKTKSGYSTDASVLEAISPLHEVPRLLLEFREIAKLKGTYVDPLPTMVDAKTGRVHAGFHQTVAATGRLSSSDPNLQNIPVRTERGRLIRRAFIPAPGHVLLSADYSQIELRLLAHLSGDPELVASFKKDEDVHRRTASEIFGVKPEAIDDRQRGVAKAINFGLMYGKTAFGLAAELGIPRAEAQDVIKRYFERYRGVKEYLDRVIEEAKERGFSQTLLGRKRPLPGLRASNPAIRQGAERMAMNTPIQGTAADLMKLAMIELDRRLPADGLKSRLILQVHDEFVLECPPDEVPAATRLLTEIMENTQKFDVPLRVNVATGANWAEL